MLSENTLRASPAGAGSIEGGSHHSELPACRPSIEILCNELIIHVKEAALLLSTATESLTGSPY